jgi:hypothetical protein
MAMHLVRSKTFFWEENLLPPGQVQEPVLGRPKQ